MFTWFTDSHMKATSHAVSWLLETNLTAKIGKFDIKNSKKEKLLGVKKTPSFTLKIKFHLAKTTSQKLYFLARRMEKFPGVKVGTKIAFENHNSSP